MHITFQFPLIDYRPLLANDSGKLDYPEWPVNGTKPNRYIKKFGRVEKRMSGGSEDWPGESFYCNAHLTIQYDKLQHQGFEVSAGNRAAIFNSYRRFTANENFLGRLEAGFVDNVEKIIREENLQENSVSIESIIEHYAELPVSINEKPEKLYRAGPLLAQSYYQSSTAKETPLVEKQKMIIAGEVVVIGVYSGYEQFKLPHYISLVSEFPLPDEQGKLKLFGGSLKHKQETLKIWLIEMPAGYNRGSKPVREKLRNLRINLLRVHIEKETIRLLLNAIKSKHIQLKADSEQAIRLDDYFEKTLELIFKKERYSIPQERLLDFALKSEDTVEPGILKDLEEGIKIFKKKFVQKGINRLVDSLNGVKKKVILLICACPENKNPLRYSKEYQQIKEIVHNGEDRFLYEIPIIEATVKKDEFLFLLARYKPDYLHIAMHSSIKEGLLFEGESGEKLPMSVEEFVEEIGKMKTVNKPAVIILSACNTKPYAAALKGLCDYAIGTQAAIPDEAAILFTTGFYTYLLEGLADKIPFCHERGQEYIEKNIEKFDNTVMRTNEIPVLFNHKI